MSDNTLFSDLIVTADSHEQANCEVKTRVLGLQKFVEEMGGCFQVEHLGDGYGLDYKVEGYFKDKEISLGIEYKQFLNDFVPNHGTLEKRLGAAREHYDNIALIIEGEALARTSRLVGDKNIWYVNPAVQDGLANQLMNRQMFEDRMQVWTESGILIRNIKQEEDFPDTFLYLLEYITKADDWYSKHKIDLPNTSFKNQYINMLLAPKIDKIGLKTAEKIISMYPNPYWLIVDGEDNLKDNLGKVTGGKLFNFFNNKDLITVEWQNGGNKTQLSKETEKSLKSNPEQSSEVKNPELAYLDNHNTKCIEVPKGKYQNGGQLFDVVPTIEEILENGSYLETKESILKEIRKHIKGIGLKELYATYKPLGLSEDIYYQIIKSLMQDDGEIYEPKLGLLVATNPLQSSNGEHKEMGVHPKSSIPDTPASQTLAGAGSKSSSDERVQSPHLKSTSDNDSVGVSGASYKTPTDLKSSSAVTVGSHTIASSSNIPATGTPDTLPEAPENSEFKANPRLKDVVEFIRRHPRTTEDIGKEFGFSPEYCLKALYALKDEHKKIWFEKATLTWNFGIDKNPAPVVADKDYDIGLKGDEK